MIVGRRARDRTRLRAIASDRARLSLCVAAAASRHADRACGNSEETLVGVMSAVRLTNNASACLPVEDAIGA